jgi:START domain
MGRGLGKAVAGSLCACALLLRMSCGAGAARADHEADEAGWRTIRAQHGVEVGTRAEPGRALPSFRGRGEVEGSVLHVLAVVLDDERANEWARSADEAEVLRKIDARTEIVYSRARQVWPVRDRDLVMKRSVEVLQPGAEFRVRLVCLPGEKPRIEDVVRMTDCETVFWLRKIDAARTWVDFRVRADPGGASPDWLVRWAAQNVPLETLTALRRQVQKTRQSYAAVMREWEHAR